MFWSDYVHESCKAQCLAAAAKRASEAKDVSAKVPLTENNLFDAQYHLRSKAYNDSSLSVAEKFRILDSVSRKDSVVTTTLEKPAVLPTTKCESQLLRKTDRTATASDLMAQIKKFAADTRAAIVAYERSQRLSAVPVSDPVVTSENFASAPVEFADSGTAVDTCLDSSVQLPEQTLGCSVDNSCAVLDHLLHQYSRHCV